MRLASYILFIFLILVSCGKSASNDWTEINIEDLNSDSVTLTSISFQNEKKGVFSAAERGYSYIYSSTDGGASWNQFYSGEYHIHDIILVDDVFIYTAGNGGTILKSNNSGKEWTLLESRTDEPLFAIDFLNRNNGVAAGRNGTIITTTDGGETWVPRNSGSNSWLRDVAYIVENHIIAVGSGGTILHSKTGGNNWEEQDSGVTKNLSGIYFIDKNNGFASGADGTLLQTQDGGRHWQSLVSHTNSGLLDISFYNDTGYAVGFGGTILKSVDGGVNWHHEINVTDNTLRSVQMTDSNKVVVVGDRGLILLK